MDTGRGEGGCEPVCEALGTLELYVSLRVLTSSFLSAGQLFSSFAARFVFVTEVVARVAARLDSWAL